MDKQNMEEPYNGILLSNKKKVLRHATAWMNLENIRPSKEASHKDHVLYDSIYMKFPKQENL